MAQGLTRIELYLPLDIAADRGTLILGNGFARERRVDGGAKVFACDWNAVAGAAGVELAAIGQAKIAVEEKEIRSAGGLVGMSYSLRLVI